MRQFLKGFIFFAVGLVIAGACAQAKTQDSKTQDSKFSFDGKTAWDYLVKQVSFGPRVPGTDSQIKCRDWIVDELKKNCDDVNVQQLSHHWTYNGKDLEIYNVIGTQNWKDAKIHMVLLAHWDSRPFADGPNSPDQDGPRSADGKTYIYDPIPGADDGASGVAVMLELARAIKGRHPDVGVMYLFDDGEDLGPPIDEMLLGVDYFADHLPTPGPDYGILLDMIGQKNLVVPMEVNSLQRAEKLTRAFFNNAASIGLGKTFPYQEGDNIDDDHWPLLNKGIPTLDLIDFEYDYWHTVNDTPEHCSEDALVKTGQALESFLTKDPPFKP